MTGILLYLVIFLVKIFEVSLATLRIVLITKGERLKGAIIGFFEVLIWLGLISTVLINITDDPIKALVYALGFAVGNYTGSLIESLLAIGTTNIEIIAKEPYDKDLRIALRKLGFAVTIVDANGMNAKRKILRLHVPRKKVKKVVKIAKSLQNDVVITINDIKAVYGGFGIIKK
jgi:uncharacterized protein YebE (UPF0316 family)